MTLEWNYTKKYVDISMPGYVTKALYKFHHTTPSKPQQLLFKFVRPNYGSTALYAPEPDISPLLSTSGKFACSKSSELSFITLALSTMPCSLHSIRFLLFQSKATASTNHEITQFVNYAVTHPHATIRYNSSDIVLHVHSDASTFCGLNTKIRIGGFYFLSN